MGVIEGRVDWPARLAASGRLALALRRLWSWQALAFVSLLVGLYLFVGVLTFTGEPGVFTSPDETGSYIITRAFGETGKLYYERDYFVEDDLHLAHPRSLLRYEDRVVLPNSQGLPLFYGIGYGVFGDNVTLAVLVLAPLCLFFLFETAALLLRTRSLLLALAFFGLGPLLYWFSRPYWNSLGSTAFFAGGCYFAIRYYQGTRRSDLAWGGALFSISMLFRYEYAAFFLPLMAIVVLQKLGWQRWRDALRELALFGAVVTALFLIPVIALSLYVYHEPIVFPTALLGDSVSDDAGPNSVAQLVRLVWRAVLPEGLDPLLVGRNLVRFTIMLAPALTLLSVAGLVLALRRGALRVAQVAPFALLLVYYLFFVGSVDSTYLATGWDVSYEASIVRYWLLLYVVMYFFAAYALVQTSELVRDAWPRCSPRVAAAGPWVVALVLACSTVPAVWFSWTGSLRHVQAGQSFGEERRDIVADNTEADAVIYSAGELHKFIAGARDVVALPEPAAIKNDPILASAVAHNIQQVMNYRPVYFMRLGVLSGEPYLEDVLVGWSTAG